MFPSDVFVIVKIRGTDVCLMPCSPQALQHGAGERQGDVDRAAKDWQGQEEIKAGQQGQVHLKNVSPWRLCHFSS